MTLGVGEVFAGYTVLRRLGAGGMGEVYLAQHPRLPRQEALKVLRAEISSDDSFRARFIREADSVAALNHPNIVIVYDRGETDGQLWIATQYIDGQDVATLLGRRYPAGMPVEDATAIITAIADALDYAHGRGLLHRDVKPANILLSQPDRDDHRRAYLADFGIARPVQDSAGLTATNVTVGTYAYAAPEQLLGEHIDGRADQYALAATAYHLLTGTTLFPTSNPAVAISRHLNTAPPRLAATRPDLAALDPVLAVALAKDPAGRYPSCAAFAAALAAPDTPHTGGPTSVGPTMAAPIPPPPHPNPAHPAPHPAAQGGRVPTGVWIAIAAAALVLTALTLVWNQIRASTTTAAPPTTATATVTAAPSSPPTLTETFTKTVLPPALPASTWAEPTAAVTPRISVWTGVVVGTCDEGGTCGLQQRNAPFTAATRLVPDALQDGTTVAIVCQTPGDLRSNTGYGSSRSRYRLANGAYVPAVYVSTGAEALPAC